MKKVIMIILFSSVLGALTSRASSDEVTLRPIAKAATSTTTARIT